MISAVAGPPDFDEILANCTAELGQTVKLACKATGEPKPTITWYKGMYSTLATIYWVVRGAVVSYACMLHVLALWTQMDV